MHQYIFVFFLNDFCTIRLSWKVLQNDIKMVASINTFGSMTNIFILIILFDTTSLTPYFPYNMLWDLWRFASATSIRREMWSSLLAAKSSQTPIQYLLMNISMSSWKYAPHAFQRYFFGKKFNFDLKTKSRCFVRFLHHCKPPVSRWTIAKFSGQYSFNSK